MLRSLASLCLLAKRRAGTWKGLKNAQEKASEKAKKAKK